MSPQEFFETFVEGNLEDCVEAPDSIRRAFNAAIAASHLADHWFIYNKRHNPSLVSDFRDLGDYVEHLSQVTSGAFRDIRSIANAYKHLYTDINSRHGARSTIDSSGSIESIEQLDQSELASVSAEREASTSAVVFTKRDGARLEFLPMLRVVVEYWRASIRVGA